MELKHLAPYLPYGLKILRPDNRTILEMKGLINISIVFHEENGDTFGVIGKHNKPILHPLSDLTKEIEHNGEKFVPFEKLSFHLFGKSDREYYLNSGIIGLPFWVSQKYFEWHFDVFGLIEKGEAIDINKI